MSATDVILGVLAGSVGAGAHLAVTWMRARAVTQGRTGRALALLPVGFIALGLAVWAATRIAPAAAWASVVGIVLTRSVALALVRERP